MSTLSSPALPSPRRAVVLAAGVGERLRPFTWFVPKPLMPLGGLPLIEQTLRRLELWGVDEIAVNLHWQAPLLREYLARRAGTARIVCSDEPLILGTGGALRPLRDFLGDAPFWLVNADIVWRLSPLTLLRAFARAQPLAAVWLTAERGPRTVETGADGRVTTYRSARPGSAGTATFCGVQLVSPRLFAHLPPAGACSVVSLYEAAAAAGERVIGVTSRGARWDDAGSVERYARLRRLARPPRRPPPPAPACDYPFHFDARGAVWFDALAWPDPALAPALAALGWPLHETGLQPLAARGSDRAFLRLRRGAAAAIFVRYGTARAENARYAGHARLLAAAGVPVPAVRAELPEARALVLEDVGAISLLDRLRAAPDEAEALYRPLLAVVARLHTAGTAQARDAALEPPFDARLYHWEQQLFVEHLLRRRHGWTVLPAALAADYGRVTAALEALPPVLLHRDLQSTNVLLRGGRLRLIDFQGMRLGPAAYDLASLLCDPYAQLAAPLRRRLLAHYAALCPESEASIAAFAWGAVQRLTQALGAYGRLTALGMDAWAAHIVPAAILLQEMAGTCGLEAIAAIAGETAAREQARGRQGGV